MGLQRQNGRAAGLLFAGVLSAALLSGSALRSWADDDYTSGQKSATVRNPTLDVDFAETPLPAALELIKKQIGSISFVFQGGTQNGYGTVTISVHNKPVNSILELVAKSAGADIWQEDGIYYIGPKGSHQTPAPAPVEIKELGPQITAPVPKRLAVIHLNWSDARVVVQQLTDTADPGDVIHTSVPALLDMNGMAHTSNNTTAAPMSSLIQRNDKYPQNGTISLIPGYNGEYGVPPAVPTGQSQGNVGASTGAAQDTGAHRSDGQEFYRGQGLQGGGGFGQGGFGQGGQPGGGVPGGQGFGQGQQFQGGPGSARGLLPEGMTPQDITAISNNNTIIVRYPDTPEGEASFRELQQRIRLLDVKPKQIQVRAQFVTLLQQDADQFGINWQFQKVNLVGQLNAGYSPSGQALLQFATGNLQMQLNFALTTGRGKVVASPMATTFNNVPAVFDNTTTYYAFIPQTFIGPGGAAQTTYYPQPIPAESTLRITPRINGDNTITLTGLLFFSDLSGTATAPDGTSIPIITSQSVPSVTRIIRNGETMVLAGLIRKSDNTSTQRVPLLGDLPLIGSLFRSRSINTDDSELLVFITATILNDPIPTGSVTNPGSSLITVPNGPTGNQ